MKKVNFYSRILYQDVICNMDNIYKAYRKAHKGKRDDKRVINFDSNKDYNLYKIHKELCEKGWKVLFDYYRFTIKEPKERIVDALEFDGRIVQHILCDEILKPFFENRLIYRNCACRETKGTDFANNNVKQDLVDFAKHHKEGYCLKMDIKKYFPSIDRETLKKQLMIFPDKQVREFIFFIIDSSPEKNGLPIGNQTSQWFALFYLNELDRQIKEKYRIKYYTRYMDDLIIIHEDKEYLLKMKEELTTYIKDNLKLEFNGKTQVFPLKKGISFLGWKYRLGANNKVYKKIDSRKKHFRNKTLKEMQRMLDNGEITTKQYNERMLSYRHYLNKGNTYNYQKTHNCKFKKENENMPIKKDATKTSTFDGNIVGVNEEEKRILDGALEITKIKENLLAQIDQLGEEILKIKAKIELDDEEVATADEVNEGIVEETSIEE